MFFLFFFLHSAPWGLHFKICCTCRMTMNIFYSNTMTDLLWLAILWTYFGTWHCPQNSGGHAISFTYFLVVVCMQCKIVTSSSELVSYAATLNPHLKWLKRTMVGHNAFTISFFWVAVPAIIIKHLRSDNFKIYVVCVDLYMSGGDSLSFRDLNSGRWDEAQSW